MIKTCKVYLAGPDVFLKDERKFGGIKKEICIKAGLTPLYPMDNQISGIETMTLEQIREAIFHSNVKMLDECDVVIANITPYEGVDADAGTVWEMGYASGKGKPVYTYSGDVIPRGTRAVHYRELEGLLDHTCEVINQTEPESLGDSYENIMLVESVTKHKGIPSENQEALSAIEAFREVVLECAKDVL